MNVRISTVQHFPCVCIPDALWQNDWIFKVSSLKRLILNGNDCH